MRAGQVRGLVAVIGVLVSPLSLSAQSELRGHLVGAAGEPIRGALVTVVSVGYNVRSDSLGYFAIAGQRGSTLKLQFSAPNYRTDSASVLRGRTPEVREFKLVARLLSMPDTAIRVVMAPIPVQLKGVVVSGASPFRSLDLHNFYTRMKEYERGGNRGYFITPEDIEKRRPTWITQMGQDLPGIRVCSQAKVTCPVGHPLGEMFVGRNGCKMTVYVDNVRIVGGRRDDAVNQMVSAPMVAGMEVYPTALNAPPRYHSNGTCGVVLIWTK